MCVCVCVCFVGCVFCCFFLLGCWCVFCFCCLVCACMPLCVCVCGCCFAGFRGNLLLLLFFYCCCFYPFLSISTLFAYGILKSVVNLITNSPVSRTVQVACPGGEAGRCMVRHGEGAHPDWAVCVFCDDPASQFEHLPSVVQ